MGGCAHSAGAEEEARAWPCTCRATSVAACAVAIGAIVTGAIVTGTATSSATCAMQTARVVEWRRETREIPGWLPCVSVRSMHREPCATTVDVVAGVAIAGGERDDGRIHLIHEHPPDPRAPS